MNDKSTFLTLKQEGKAIIKERGSKFIGLAFPVLNENEAKEILKSLKKVYYDARHLCYGFVIGEHSDLSRASDAGEPAHSAGDPILNQIKSRSLTNTLVVVVRYFGGTKLGVGGLIQAYKSTASDALDNAGSISKNIQRTYRIQYGYMQMEQVMKTLKQYNCEILSTDFKINCEIVFSIPATNAGVIQEKLSKTEGLIFLDY